MSPSYFLSFGRRGSAGLKLPLQAGCFLAPPSLQEQSSPLSRTLVVLCSHVVVLWDFLHQPMQLCMYGVAPGKEEHVSDTGLRKTS